MKDKIKDTPIAGKLPESNFVRVINYRNKVLEDSLDINEIAEVDVGKITELFIDLMLEYERLDFVPQLSDVIAKAGILKWRKAND